MSELWCVNIQGPDDVIATASKEIAETLAANINARFKPEADKNDILFNAVVIPWPHSPESHAEDLLETKRNWGAWCVSPIVGEAAS